VEGRLPLLGEFSEPLPIFLSIPGCFPFLIAVSERLSFHCLFCVSCVFPMGVGAGGGGAPGKYIHTHIVLCVCLVCHLQAEVEHLANLKHRHVVRLLGYCREGPHWLLVYEFVP